MNKKGFSLIEMLAVVLIIGILSAVAMPQYARVREKARFAQAQVMAKSMYDSCERLLSEFDKGYKEMGADYHKVTRLDIGSDSLLPPGFSISADKTYISGAGFSYILDSTKNDCVVNVTKPSQSGLKIVFNGEKFTCSDGGAKICGDYGLD